MIERMSEFVKMMRAVRVPKFGGIKVLQIEKNIPVPTISRNQVLVKIKSAGVNPVDTYIREGAYSVVPELPFTLGKDGAGIIEAVGENVTKFKIGDRVYATTLKYGGQNGTYAEYAPIDQREAFPLPEKLTFHQGACIGIAYFTAYRALILKAGAVAGDTVLIHGASGAVGLAAVQMCKAYGINTFGTAGTEEGMKLVKENGAHQVFCHREKGYMDKIMEATDNKGVNAILEMLSNVNLGKDLNILAPRGIVTVIGCRGDVKISPRAMMGKETSIVGVALMASTEEEWERIGTAINDGIQAGWVQPVVGHIYPLSDAAQAHHDIINTKGAKGKIVLSLD